MGFPGGSAGKESACNAGDLGSIPGLGRSPGEGKGSPLQYSGLENSMDCIVHGVTKSQTGPSDFHFVTRTLTPVSGLGRSSGEEKGYPLQYSGLENSVDCIVHGVVKKQT